MDAANENHVSFGSIFDNKINLDFSDYFKIFVEIVIYMISVFSVLYYAYKYRNESIRKDALLLNKIVNYFIRSCFWAVVFVGLARDSRPCSLRS